MYDHEKHFLLDERYTMGEVLIYNSFGFVVVSGDAEPRVPRVNE